MKMIIEIAEKVLDSEKWLRKGVALKFSVTKLKWAARKCNCISDSTKLVFKSSKTFPFLYGATSIQPMQLIEEITGLLKILTRQRPKYMLEVGTADGGTLFLFTRVAASDATLITVDLPRGYSELRIPYYESFSLPDQKIRLLRMDSHEKTTSNAITSILGEQKLDFLFIDGDHKYEGVKKDFEMYSKLLSPNGITAFHDIVPGPEGRVGGVPRFWNEIKHNFSYIELVENWKQGGYGIGVLLGNKDT